MDKDNNYYDYIDSYYREHGRFPDPGTKKEIEFLKELDKKTYTDMIIVSLVTFLSILFIIYSIYETSMAEKEYKIAVL